MSRMTPAADLAWRMAAAEASSAGSARIERAHLLLGILSLEKVTGNTARSYVLDREELSSVQGERASLNELLGSLALDAADIRRAARRSLPPGSTVAPASLQPGEAPPTGPISRSAECRAVFARAAALGRESPVSSMLLLAALAEAPDAVLKALLAARHVDPATFVKRARAFGGVSAAEVLVPPPAPSRTADPVPEPTASRAPIADAPTLPRVPAAAREPPPPERPPEATEAAAPRLLRLGPFLKERLVGQDRAIERVAARLSLAQAATPGKRGPLAVLLFLGPPGVGKTELARLLAEFVAGGREALVRLDMSELQDERAASRLLGTPPARIGHDEEGLLVRHLRTRPFSVVLLDEAERAHPRVFDLFSQVFEAGRVIDARGRAVDASHAIFILATSFGGARGGSSDAATGEALARRVAEAAALEEVRRLFPPELLKRVDELILFRALDEKDARRIAGALLEQVRRDVREDHGVSVEVDPEAEAFVARSGFDPERGVRAMRQVVERLVAGPLAQLAFAGKLERHRSWQAVYDEGGVYLIPGGH